MQPPSCACIGKRLHFFCRHGPFLLPPPDIPPVFSFPQQRRKGGELLTRDLPHCQSVLSSRGELALRVQPASSNWKLQNDSSVPNPGNATPLLPPASPLSLWAAASSDAGAETEFLGSFGKTLIIYGDFSSCPAAALRGAGTLNTNVVYFRVDLIYIKLQLWCGQHRQGWRAIPAPTRACSGPASQLPSLAQLLEVELVVFPVAADVSPQAQRQAAVALTGQVGAPGPLSCGTRGAQGQPRLWGRGVSPPFPGPYSLQESLPRCQL